MRQCLHCSFLLYSLLFLKLQYTNAFQCFRQHGFHISRMGWPSFHDGSYGLSNQGCQNPVVQITAARSRKTCLAERSSTSFSRDVNFQYRHPFTALFAEHSNDEMQSSVNSPSSADGNGMNRNANIILTNVAFEVCVFISRLLLEICDVFMRAGSLLLRIMFAPVQLLVKIFKGSLFYSRYRHCVCFKTHRPLNKILLVNCCSR
jgi:hypothetical protein